MGEKIFFFVIESVAVLISLALTSLCVSKYNGFACLVTFLLVTAICTCGAIHTPLTMSYQIGGTVLGLLFPLLACLLVAFFVPNKLARKKEEWGE